MMNVVEAKLKMSTDSFKGMTFRREGGNLDSMARPKGRYWDRRSIGDHFGHSHMESTGRT